MNSYKNGESGLASVGSALEFKSYNWSLLWRLSSLGVCEARSNFKFSAIFLPDDDCSAHCVASAFAPRMTNHLSFGIFKTFYFEQTKASDPFVFWIRVFYHDAFALSPANLIHQLQQVSFTFAHSLLASLYCFVRIFCQLLLYNFYSLREFFLNQGSIKNHKLDLLPLIRFWFIFSHCWDYRLKIVAAGPQLAIQSDGREFVPPFLRCKNFVAISCKHMISIPVTSHTVELLTHEPVRRVVAIGIVSLSKHHFDWACFRFDLGLLLRLDLSLLDYYLASCQFFLFCTLFCVPLFWFFFHLFNFFVSLTKHLRQLSGRYWLFNVILTL